MTRLRIPSPFPLLYPFHPSPLIRFTSPLPTTPTQTDRSRTSIPQADLRFLVTFCARHVGPGAGMLDLRPRGQAGVLSGQGRSELERSARWQVTKGRCTAALPLHWAVFCFGFAR
ncbi:uncharacterized protein K441DRAFT_350900 [Cenococcum geophilum 1.58]|uniref:Uncharacterized protein n=1 Tax=Cenococcum geophilum 1.58 TaxID=794803 RepID=A0ACC8EN11_9PEZI|nr:hypothetical protein K441DRAFT_350900 [Cenococcum geophilum 1.58]